MSNYLEELKEAGWSHVYSGKVRDLYEHETDKNLMLIIASDRISAFDHVLEPPLQGKGALLTRLSKWWFEKLDVPNHLVASHPPIPDAVVDRAMVAKKLRMLPVECVVRGVLTGSGYKEYLESSSVCGVSLPAGLKDGDLLATPIFTPAYKAPLGEHDENITFAETVELVGAEKAERLREISLAIFERAAKLANERGLILADTKFEFGVEEKSGEILLADEVLTSDSSRYLDKAAYFTNPVETRMQSFDKQIVREWLKANWDGTGAPPAIPQEIAKLTLARYAELLEKFLEKTTY